MSTSSKKDVFSVMLKAYWRLFIQLLKSVLGVCIAAFIVCNILYRLGEHSNYFYPINKKNTPGYQKYNQDVDDPKDIDKILSFNERLDKHSWFSTLEPEEDVENNFQKFKYGRDYIYEPGIHKTVKNCLNSHPNNGNVGFFFNYVQYKCYKLYNEVLNKIHVKNDYSSISFMFMTLVLSLMLKNQSSRAEAFIGRLFTSSKKINKYSIEGIIIGLLCDVFGLTLFFFAFFYAIMFIGFWWQTVSSLWSISGFFGIFFSFSILLSIIPMLLIFVKDPLLLFNGPMGFGNIAQGMKQGFKVKNKIKKKKIKKKKKKKNKKKLRKENKVTRIFQIISMILLLVPTFLALQYSGKLSYILTINPLINTDTFNQCKCKMREYIMPLTILIILFSLISILNVLGQNACIYSVIFVILFTLYKYFFGNKNELNFIKNSPVTCNQ